MFCVSSLRYCRSTISLSWRRITFLLASISSLNYSILIACCLFMLSRKSLSERISMSRLTSSSSLIVSSCCSFSISSTVLRSRSLNYFIILIKLPMLSLPAFFKSEMIYSDMVTFCLYISRSIMSLRACLMRPRKFLS